MPRQVRLLCHPFHNGWEGVDTGAGPLRLITDPAPAEFSSETIDAPDASHPEIVRIAEGDRRLAQAVRSSAADEALPDRSLGFFDAMGLVFTRFEVAAAAIAAYDPGLDKDGRMARAALRVLAAMARGAS